MKTALGFALGVVLLGCGCQPRVHIAPPPAPVPTPLVPAGPSKPGPPAAFVNEKLREMDRAIQQAVGDRKCPGGVLWLEREGTSYHKAYGNRAVVPTVEAMTEETIFDAASLTKVVATTPAILLLIERGKVILDAPVSAYIPEFTGAGKEAITIRQLLTHTSGLRPDISLQPAWTGYDTAIRLACAEVPASKPDERFIYSDINFLVLGEVVRRQSGEGLDQFLAREVYEPLKMVDTGFRPATNALGRIAPTEVVEGVPFRGVVHDPTARRMGGVAGHAGLFTTTSDLARFCRMMLNGGELEGARVFKADTVRLMTRVHTAAVVPARRGLGWDIDSPYAGQRGKIFPIGGYGHTGWTGTSLWIDPFSRTFVIFLSNRNHPDEKGNVIGLRNVLGTLAAEAVAGFDFKAVPGALAPRKAEEEETRPRPDGVKTVEVLNGIDVLVRDRFAPLKGLKVGLITNHTGHDRHRTSTIDLLHHAPGVALKALFSPEHGIRGLMDEAVGDSVDEKTGVPIHSLYGQTRQPSPEQLRDLDALVFDIQDIGCRFYTYISTMGLAMEAAAKSGKKMFILDRVNPIGGLVLDGPAECGPSSFTAYHPIAVRHGMTVGELAGMFNSERALKCDLTVIRLEGWSREFWFDQTGQPWTNPSPNMRSLTEATLYPGVGLLETTALSVGRGTGTPFEVVGAPFIDDVKLAAEVNRVGLAGVRFVPVRFTPDASVFKGEACAGVQILLTDRERCQVVDIGITIARTLHRLYPAEFNLDKFNRLLAHPATLETVRAGSPTASIRESWAPELSEFAKRRAKFLLY